MTAAQPSLVGRHSFLPARFPTGHTFRDSCFTQTPRFPYPPPSANSCSLILLRTLCRRQKSQPLCNQANPHSLGKTPGVGYPDSRIFPISDTQASELGIKRARRYLCMEPPRHRRCPTTVANPAATCPLATRKARCSQRRDSSSSTAPFPPSKM